MSILAIILVSVYVGTIIFKSACDIAVGIWIIKILNSESDLEKLADKTEEFKQNEKDIIETYNKEKKYRSKWVNLLITICPIWNVIDGIKVIIQRKMYLGEVILIFSNLNKN